MTNNSEQVKNVGLFDFLNDITHQKNYLYDENTKSQYNAFMILRGLGQHIDIVLLANELNKRPNMSKQMHHDFLYYSIDARKRYGKWAKEDKLHDQEVIDYVKEHYQCNEKIAIEHYLKLLSKEEISSINKKLKMKGGRM